MKKTSKDKSLTIVIVLYKESYELICKTLDLIKNFKIIMIKKFLLYFS